MRIIEIEESWIMHRGATAFVASESFAFAGNSFPRCCVIRD